MKRHFRTPAPATFASGLTGTDRAQFLANDSRMPAGRDTRGVSLHIEPTGPFFGAQGDHLNWHIKINLELVSKAWIYICLPARGEVQLVTKHPPVTPMGCTVVHALN